MTLRELDGKFIKATGPRSYRYLQNRAGVVKRADGISFLCPKCFAKNKGPVGTHGVVCWFVGKVPDDRTPGPGRWTPSGTGLDDLTFVPGIPPQSVSVQLHGGCEWHGFVRNGEATLS